MRSMCVFISDLSGIIMVVDTHIVPQTAVHLTNFFNRDRSMAYFTSRTSKYRKHACAASLLRILLKISRNAENVVASQPKLCVCMSGGISVQHQHAQTATENKHSKNCLCGVLK